MIAADLPARDQAVLEDLARVRLLTGQQLEILEFSKIAAAGVRSSVRRRSMQRLQNLGLVTTLPRKVGGERAGSAGLVYSLDVAGQRLVRDVNEERVRRPWPIGPAFVAHTLDVAELYVRFREGERTGGLKLVRFDAEPASWYGSAVGTLKPDAYVVYLDGEYEEYRWIEVDRSTESLPTLRRKLMSYLDLFRIGALGPDGVFPLVVITVLDERRRTVVQRLLDALPEPAEQLFTLTLSSELFVAGGRPPPQM